MEKLPPVCIGQWKGRQKNWAWEPALAATGISGLPASGRRYRSGAAVLERQIDGCMPGIEI